MVFIARAGEERHTPPSGRSCGRAVKDGLSSGRRFGYAQPVLLWLHLVATGLFLGATLGLALFPVRRVRSVTDPLARRRALVRVLRFYDPLAIALLGVIVMTGAYRVTALKESLGSAYFASFSAHLAWKLALAFLVVMSGTYLAMGIGHRLVRQEEWNEPVDERKLGSMIGRLGGAAWVTALLTVATLAVAMRIG